MNSDAMTLVFERDAKIRELRADNERLRALLPRLRNYISAERTVDRPKEAMLELIDKALEAQPKPTDAQLARYHGDVDGDAEL